MYTRISAKQHPVFNNRHDALPLKQNGWCASPLQEFPRLFQKTILCQLEDNTTPPRRQYQTAQTIPHDLEDNTDNTVPPGRPYRATWNAGRASGKSQTRSHNLATIHRQKRARSHTAHNNKRPYNTDKIRRSLQVLHAQAGLPFRTAYTIPQKNLTIQECSKRREMRAFPLVPLLSGHSQGLQPPPGSCLLPAVATPQLVINLRFVAQEPHPHDNSARCSRRIHAVPAPRG